MAKRAAEVGRERGAPVEDAPGKRLQKQPVKRRMGGGLGSSYWLPAAEEEPVTGR